jgi:hypothetical protein
MSNNMVHTPMHAGQVNYVQNGHFQPQMQGSFETANLAQSQISYAQGQPMYPNVSYAAYSQQPLTMP